MFRWNSSEEKKGDFLIAEPIWFSIDPERKLERERERFYPLPKNFKFKPQIIQKDRQTDRQTNRQTDKTDKKTDRQTNIQTCSFIE